MEFEAYLISKKIDSDAFKTVEPNMWNSWSAEFKLMHPNSFTAQKLYLINPVRRKYPLKQQPVQQQPVRQEPSQTPIEPPQIQDAGPPPSNPKPSVPRPVFKPKPKMT
jgi:hypothetical protein